MTTKHEEKIPLSAGDSPERSNDVMGILMRRLDVRMLVMAAKIAIKIVDGSEGAHTAATERLTKLATDLQDVADHHNAYSVERGANPPPYAGTTAEGPCPKKVNPNYDPLKLKKRLH